MQYWSIYTLDIYLSTVWGGCFHFQEAHARVDYPQGISSTPQTGDSDWIVGWNFTTDLYRILEHALTRLRTRNSKFNLFCVGGGISGSSPAGTVGSGNGNILERVDGLYLSLPSIFKELRPATGNISTDIYGFQAANIQATLALLRMVLFSLEIDADMGKKCAVAEDILTIFHHVPKSFQRAISTPLIYHIASIGNILGSVMEGPLSETSYQRVRGILLSMASLLESLEAFLRRRAGAGKHLRELVERIDAYMASRREIPTSGTTQEADPGELPTANVDGDVMENLSPLFQLPDELLQDWNWPLMILADTEQPFI